MDGHNCTGALELVFCEARQHLSLGFRLPMRHGSCRGLRFEKPAVPWNERRNVSRELSTVAPMSAVVTANETGVPAEAPAKMPAEVTAMHETMMAEKGMSKAEAET